MLLMSRGEELFLIRFFDPPPSATIIFLGSLRGGVYSARPSPSMTTRR